MQHSIVVRKKSVKGSRDSVEVIKREIVAKFGYIPQLFIPAFRSPHELKALWQEALAGYINNGLPALWKEILFAFLSKECGNNYCVIVHSCKLKEFKLTSQEIRDLFTGFERLGIAEELKKLLRLSLEFYKNPAKVSELVPQLKEVLGKYYDDWVSFISFLVAIHRWVEGYADEISYQEDELSKKHLRTLLSEAEELKKIFRVQ